LPAKGVFFIHIPFGKTEFDLFHRGGEIPHILILRLRAFSFISKTAKLLEVKEARCSEDKTFNSHLSAVALAKVERLTLNSLLRVDLSGSF